MASIRKREWVATGKKRIAWLVDFKDKLGRRRAKQFSTLSEAREWLGQTDLSSIEEASALTVGDAARAWLARAESEDLEKCTLK